MTNPGGLVAAWIVAAAVFLAYPVDAQTGKGASAAAGSGRPVVTGVLRSWPPYYTTTEDGQPAGFAIDIIEVLARRAGIALQYRVFDRFLDLNRAMDAGEIDLVPNSGVTTARSQKYLFTRPVHVISVAIFVRAGARAIDGLQGLDGVRTGVVVDNYGHEALKARPGVRLSVFRDPETMMWALLSGQIDAVVYPADVFNRLVRLVNVEDRVRLVGRPLREIRRAIRVSSGRPDLYRAIEAEVEPFLESPEYRALYEKWFGVPQPFWTIPRVLVAGVALIVLLIALLVAWRYFSVLRINRALRESEAHLNQLIDSSPDGSILHQDGVIVYANVGAARLLGYDSPQEIVGKQMIGLVAPEERDAVLGRRAARDAGERLGLAEGQHVRRDGTRVDTERSSVVISWHGRPAHLLQLRDITERKEYDRFREGISYALDHLPSAIALFDAEEKLVAWNSHFGSSGRRRRGLMQRGMAFESLLRDRLATGNVPEAGLASREAGEAWVAERLRQFREAEGPVETMVNGQWRQVRNERLPDGGIALISTDITDIKRREEQLRLSEERFRSVFESSGMGIVLVDDKAGYVRVNRAFCDFVGYEEAELLGKAPSFLALPEDRPKVAARVARLLSGEDKAYQEERSYRHRSGEIRWGLIVARTVQSELGENMFLAIVQDITEAKRAQQALIASEARFRSVFEAGGAGINLLGPDRRFVASNRAFCDFVGYPEDELKSMSPMLLAPEEDRAGLRDRLDTMMAGLRNGYILERRYLHKDGRILWGVAYIAVLRQSGEAGVTLINVVQDVTSRKRMEEQLTLSEARFRDFAEAASDAFWEMGPDLRLNAISGRRDSLDSIPVAERLGHFRWELADPADLRENARKWAEHRSDLEAHRPFRDFQYRTLVAGGDVRYLTVSGRPVFDGTGVFAGYRGTATDITDRVEAMAEIRRLVDAIEAMDESVLLLDAEDRIVYCNSVFRRRNKSMEAYLAAGTAFRDFIRVFVRRGGVPEAAGREEDWVQERMAHHANPQGQFEMRSFDGVPMLVTEKHLADGGTVIVAMDVSALKQAEAQLVQSQKMEAVGQLTGGVAHDFNNLLTVVLGNLNLLREKVEKDSPLFQLVMPAIRAAERGATLTGRLLAFSRRQALAPSIVNIGKAITDMTALMRRVLGENIEIETVVDAGLWSCEVDPVQLENALLNMAINARDAMAEGGKLTIEAGNARLDDEYAAQQADVLPGQYVMISVTDTGTGMTPDVRGRVFDPFFTTKEVGRGTGLGLSMVYGFVKQSGGHISVYSELGEGTTFKIYLPRVVGREDRQRAPAAAAGEMRGDGETILVVEDDDDVRVLTVAMLEDLGYRTISVGSAQEARKPFADGEHVDLLLTDVVLPGGESGRVLAESLLVEHPGLRVLYMSGYTENAIIHHGRLDEGLQLLQKPFRKLDLQRKVRRALARDAAGDPPD